MWNSKRHITLSPNWAQQCNNTLQWVSFEACWQINSWHEVPQWRIPPPPPLSLSQFPLLKNRADHQAHVCLTFGLCYRAGRGIRRSCSQICPASRCYRSGGSRSSLSSVRFKTIAKKSDWSWRPPHLTTRPCLDRRYSVCVCVCEAESDRQVVGGWWPYLGERMTHSDDLISVCLSLNQKWHIVFVRLLCCYVSMSSCSFFLHVPSVSDWGEELAGLHCSAWLGQNQQVSSLCIRTTNLLWVTSSRGLVLRRQR